MFLIFEEIARFFTPNQMNENRVGDYSEYVNHLGKHAQTDFDSFAH